MKRPIQLLSLLLLAFSAFAQATGETIDVSLINLDVFVTDKRGQRVYGLTPADFEIRENGKLQPISNFTEFLPQGRPTATGLTVDAPPAPANAATGEAAPHAKRTIVIFVEVIPQPTERVREVFASLREFVQSAVRPGDAATVIAFRARARTVQNFTDDRAALALALGELEEESVGLSVDSRGAMARARESDARMAAVAESRMAAPGASAEELERKAGEYFALLQVARKSHTMTSVMESLSGVEGKKIMVLALHDFGIRPLAAGARLHVQSLFHDRDTRIDRFRAAVTRTANANNFTLYPLNVPGMQWGASFDGPEVVREDVFSNNSDADLARYAADNTGLLNQTASLYQIAKETGGLMAAGPYGISDLMADMLDDLDSYYSLAYRATPSGQDQQRKVTVTAKNRSYRVRSRHAIVEKSDDKQMSDRVVANLFQTSEYSVIPLRVDVGEIRKTGRKRWQVPVTVHVPVTALTPRSQGDSVKGSFSVFLATGGELGVISDVERREQEYAYAASAAASRDFTYKATIEIDHFPDTISIGVRDDVSKEFGLARATLPSRYEPRIEKGGALD